MGTRNNVFQISKRFDIPALGRCTGL